ncbi:hypothetical protein D3C80_577540 [compost metagenome]
MWIKIDDIQYLVAKFTLLQLVGNPFTVLVVLAAQNKKVLADIKFIDPAALFQVVEKGIGAAGVGHGHQIGHKWYLEGGIVKHQAEMPVKLLGAIKEDGFTVCYRLCQCRKSQIERSDANANKIIGIIRVVIHFFVFYYLFP